MTKKSGIAVTIKAFFPARANDMEHMRAAMAEIEGLLNSIREGGVVLDVQQRFMLSREVPDAPVAGPVATTTNAGHGPVTSNSYVATNLPEGTTVTPTRMPDIPTDLDATKRRS